MDEANPVRLNYREIFRRRLPIGIISGLILVALTVAIAVGLPASYKSEAIILIEKQDIPQDLVRSLVTSYADQRIQVISQRVLTNANLLEIIEKYNLYAEDRKSDPLELVIEKMRDDVTVQPISADVVDERSGRPTKATIAFELGFESISPVLAQRVANDLVSLFLNANLQQRAETTEETLTFLSEETEKLGANVAELESRLAAFKEKNAGALPELSGLNLQLMNNQEQHLNEIRGQIRSLEQQKVYLESELAQQDPITGRLVLDGGERILSPTDRLKSLETQYLTLSAKYAETHPDVVAMRNEIKVLKRQAGGVVPDRELAVNLEALKRELATAEERYGSAHPDVKRIRRELQAVKAEVATAKTVDVDNEYRQQATPDNPIYIQLRARLDATNADLVALRTQQRTVSAKIEEFEHRLTAAPQVEREYRALTRDYENALTKYQEILAKRQEADLARSLENEQRGERFTLIEPPIVPEQPDKPNRWAIGLFGLILSFSGALGIATFAEAIDTRIYGRSGIVSVTGNPPLAVIPSISNSATRISSYRLKIGIALIVMVLILIVAAGVHFLFGPLDVLYFRILRVMGL